MSLQIGTAHFFARATAQLSAQQARADRLNTQIATGVRVGTPSVDPTAASRAAGLDRLAADDTQYLANMQLASSLLGGADKTLGTMETQLQRARELAIAGANETATPADRRIYATELRAIVDDLYALANTADARGTPLFGGSADGPAYTRDPDGTVRFAGSGEASAIPIGDGVAIAAGDSGARLFGGIDSGPDGEPRDMFAMLSALADTLSDDTLTVADRRAATDAGLGGLKSATDRLAGARASVGARMARLEVETARVEDLRDGRVLDAKALTAADLQQSIAELKETMLVLDAASASFAKVSQLSLFDYIR